MVTSTLCFIDLSLAIVHFPVVLLSFSLFFPLRADSVVERYMAAVDSAQDAQHDGEHSARDDDSQHQSERGGYEKMQKLLNDIHDRLFSDFVGTNLNVL